MSECAVEDCERPVKGRGWCSTHYARWRRTGSVELKQYPKACMIAGCDDDVLARGWCKKHYERWKRHGDPETKVAGRDPNPPETCTIYGCEGKNRGRGLCPKHYWRWREYGDPLAGGPELMEAPEDALCVVDGCGKAHHARGFCDNHYRRWERHQNPLGGRPPAPELPDDGLCVVDGCPNPITRRDMCYPHYRRWVKYDDPLGGTDWFKEVGNPDGSCLVDGCDLLGDRGRNLCGKHYYRFRRHGDPLAGGTERGERPPNGLCTVDGCDREFAARSMCLMHYAQWKHEQNPEERRERSRKRRALKAHATIHPFYSELIPLRMSMFSGCWICGDALDEGYHVDHVKPLAQGGAHALANLRPACPICNISKSAAWPFDTTTTHLRFNPKRLP